MLKADQVRDDADQEQAQHSLLRGRADDRDDAVGSSKANAISKSLIAEVRRVSFLLVVGIGAVFLFSVYHHHQGNIAIHTEHGQQVQQEPMAQLQQLGLPIDSDSSLLASSSSSGYPVSALRQSAIDNMIQSIVRTKVDTMVRANRVLATVRLGVSAILENVPGDFVETGVFRGGTSILLLKTLLAFDQSRSPRILWAADSFEGFPEDIKIGAEEEKQLPDSLGLNIISNIRGAKGKLASSLEVFQKNLELHKIPLAKVKILKGFFNDTLPNAPINKISFLRMDGDLYVSTMDTFKALYPKLSKGGYIYIDDYGSFVGCRKAVEEYRNEHGITDLMYPINEMDNDMRYEAVWWRKSTD